jgi:hypothetical protein
MDIATDNFLQYSMHGSMDSVMKFAQDADVHGTEKVCLLHISVYVQSMFSVQVSLN